jgi:hypothetical protein
MLTYNFAGRRTSHVHGNITAADHDDFLPNRELVPKIHVEQEIDPLVNAVEIYAGNAQIAAAMRSHRNQDRVESLLT